MKEVALHQGCGAIWTGWRQSRRWRYSQELALYQGSGAIWRGGTISRKWRYIEEVAPYEGVAPYQGSGATSRRWRHMKGVAPYQGSGAISRRWCYIQELASYPDETRPIVQTAVPLTSSPPRPARLIISPAAHHSVNTQCYKCSAEANRWTPSLWLKHKVSGSDGLIERPCIICQLLHWLFSNSPKYLLLLKKLEGLQPYAQNPTTVRLLK
jgi:hypothetical protein